MVVYSKEMPKICGNCEANLETAFFRCLDCGEAVRCPNCDPRSSFDEDCVPPSRPFHPPSCPRGDFAFRGRGFHDHPSHLSCPRGRSTIRGGHFHLRPQSPYDRPSFSTAAPFCGASRGCGFGPRGFGGAPPRCPCPDTFGPAGEDFSPMMGRGGFGPFAAAPRGHAGFPRGIPGMGMIRGRGGFGGRGGLRPCFGARGMGCGKCNHENISPEMVGENIYDPSGESCPRGEPCPGVDHHPGREPCPGKVGSDHQENIPNARGESCAETVVVDREG